MTIYGPDAINFDGVNGDRYWFHEPFAYTGVADIDERLSGFPVAVFVPQNRPAQHTPLVIGLQGMSAPYGWNAFIVSTMKKICIAVALFDTPFAGERSLVRTSTAMVQNEIQPLVNRGISFDTNDSIVNIRDARACAQRFPDGSCYLVPGMGHGTRQWGPLFVDHVRYFLSTQLGDWQN